MQYRYTPWATLSRLSPSTEFVLPVPTRARFPGRVSRSTGHASSIRTSLDKARDATDGPPGSCCPSHEWPILQVPRCTSCSERQTPTLRQGSALNLFRAPPRSSAMRNSTPRGHSFRFPVLVPQTPKGGNELDTFCAGTSRPGSGSARGSGRGGGEHRSHFQQPGHGIAQCYVLAAQGSGEACGGRMTPRRWSVRESPGAASGTDGNGHGRAVTCRRSGAGRRG
jgi:hypothetical protein